MTDSMAVVVDSLVRHSLAVQDSLALAKESGLDRFLETPLFKVGWPTGTAVFAFYAVRFFNRRDKNKERTEKKMSTAETAALYLAHASKMLEALDIRLVNEGPIVHPRASEYAPARNVLEHVATFEHFKGDLGNLGDIHLSKGIIDWHRMATSDLDELIDYRTMSPGEYMATHAPGKSGPLELRFIALRASLAGDRGNARHFAEILIKIAKKKLPARFDPEPDTSGQGAGQ